MKRHDSESWPTITMSRIIASFYHIWKLGLILLCNMREWARFLLDFNDLILWFKRSPQRGWTTHLQPLKLIAMPGKRPPTLLSCTLLYLMHTPTTRRRSNSFIVNLLLYGWFITKGFSLSDPPQWGVHIPPQTLLFIIIIIIQMQH